MKPTALILCCFIVFAFRAEYKKNSVSQHVFDDGKTLTLTIDAVKENSLINYKEKFDVTGLNKAQKDALILSITDSLGITKH